MISVSYYRATLTAPAHLSLIILSSLSISVDLPYLFQWALHFTNCEWYAFLYASLDFAFRASTAIRLGEWLEGFHEVGAVACCSQNLPGNVKLGMDIIQNAGQHIK